jgi:arylsulfatase A-like enzyme
MKTVVSVIAAIAAALYLHPGTKHTYISYVPGIVSRILYRPGPYQDIQWNTPVPVPVEVGAQSTSASLDGVGRRPNIVVIVADDLGYNDLFGGAGVATPNIDSLRKTGVEFTQAYAGHATCSPARASLLTGRFPSRFGFEFTAVPWQFSWVISRPIPEAARQPVFKYHLLPSMPPSNAMNVPIDEIMIPKFLKANNYSTAYIGKWHLGSRAGYVPWDRGFDETLGFLGGAAMYLDEDDPDIVNEYLGDSLDDFLFSNLRDIVQQNGTRKYFKPMQYLTDYFALQTANCIRTKLAPPADPRKAAPPLFMYVAFNAPHTPLQAKKEDYDTLHHIADHKQRVYAAMILALDRGVGTILQALEDTNQRDNTLVILTSDNGAPSYVGIPHLNRPFRGWKATFFEGGVHVPMLMSWPKMLPQGVTFDRPVSHVDIFGTAAAVGATDDNSLDGLLLSKKYDGVNLVPFVLESMRTKRDTCSVDSQICSKTSSSLLLDPHSDGLFWRTGSYLAFRYGDIKMQLSSEPDRVWLVNLQTDPTEQVNLASGLTWTALNASLAASDNDEFCVRTLLHDLATARLLNPRNLQMLSFPLPDSLRIACHVGRKLLTVNAEQSEPLWPALSETPVPVDAASYSVRTDDEEFVYWAN